MVIRETQPDPPDVDLDTKSQESLADTQGTTDDTQGTPDNTQGTPDNKEAKTLDPPNIEKKIRKKPEEEKKEEVDVVSSEEESSSSRGTAGKQGFGSSSVNINQKRDKTPKNKKGAGRKKKVVDPSAEYDLEIMGLQVPKVMSHCSIVDHDGSVSVLFRPNLVFFNQPDLHISTASLSALFSNGAIGCMIVADQDLHAGLDAILTPTLTVKKQERPMFTLDRTIVLSVPNKTKKLNRGGMCCNILHLLVFTLTTNKTEVRFYPFPDSDDECPEHLRMGNSPKKTNPIIPQVWKVAPLGKPERKPFKDVKLGRQIPTSTYTTILTHMYQQAVEGGTILNKSIVQIGIGHGSLLIACIKVF